MKKINILIKPNATNDEIVDSISDAYGVVYEVVKSQKDGFQFATAALLPRLLDEFERQYLSRWTPCTNLAPDELMNAIAVTHVELIVIHPFREGNGRLSRLLADVMAVQAGHEPLDYSAWEQHKAAYIGAIHAGFSGDYARMCEFVASAIQAGNASVSERV